MPPRTAPLILGWEEWVALPELGLPAVKAKVDTGARTSALHAYGVEPFGPPRARNVPFCVHPVPRRDHPAIACTARLVDRREVRSSNGERETRYVIETPIRIGEREWRIEVTLANRNMMTYRMLLGRQAIPEGVLVDPSASFLQPRLRYKAYGRPNR
jgi:ribosomal protein S6--L-glutamate ligase